MYLKSGLKNNKAVIIAGWVSIILNILLFGIKYYAGIVSNSVALTADAWHTLTDSFSSIVLLAAVYIASKPAKKKRPYGYGRVEWVGTIIIGVLLAVIAFKFFHESINRLINNEKPDYNTVAIVVTIISLVVKEIMARYSFFVAKKANSSTLKADAWHHRSDAISSLVILSGIYAGKYFPYLDGILGILVSLLIAYAAYETFTSVINLIIGEEPPEELINKLKKISKQLFDTDLKIHHVNMHHYGKHIEITFHICLPGNMSLKEVHNISHKFEEEIKKQLNIYSTIHVDDYQQCKTHNPNMQFY